MSRVVSMLAVGIAVMAVATGATACGSSDEPDPLLILAASSTTGYLDDFIAEFQAAHSDLAPVTISYGGSNALLEQAASGAPADLVITAGLPTDLGTPVDPSATVWGWVRNELVVAVPAGNPGGVTSIADLAQPDLRVAICAREVPCGQALGEQYDTLAPDSVEPTVRSVLTKIDRGEVDAGIVYRTDAATLAGVEIIDITPPPSTEYAVISLDPANALAEIWAVALRNEGADFFTDRGFQRGSS